MRLLTQATVTLLLRRMKTKKIKKRTNLKALLKMAKTTIMKVKTIMSKKTRQKTLMTQLTQTQK